jgi:hypothetical protein
MIYESLEALEAKLAERYDGPLSQREGAGGKLFTYIPWTETVRRLNAVFGAFGWDTHVVSVTFVDGVYTVAVELTVSGQFKQTRQRGDALDEYIDSESKTVVGVGSAVARGQSDDNASKAALSDAISRAAKLLGDQFGFFLYEKAEKTSGATNGGYKTPASSSASSAASGDLGRRPSEKQAAILNKQGIAYESMPFAEWKAALDAYFEERNGGF